MCAPYVDLGDSGGGSAEMGSAAWGKMLGVLASAGSGGEFLANELSAAHAGNEDWIARQKQEEVKFFTDGKKWVTMNAADLPPEMLAAYGYKYDPIYGVEPLDYDNPHLGQSVASPWVRGSDGDLWAPSVTGEVVDGSLIEIPPAAGYLAGSASLLTNHEFDDLRPPRLDERLAQDVPVGGIGVAVPSDATPQQIGDAVVKALLGGIPAPAPVPGLGSGSPNAAPRTSTSYDPGLVEEQTRSYSDGAAQADAAQQGEYDEKVASRWEQADQLLSRLDSANADAGPQAIGSSGPGDVPGSSPGSGQGDPMDPAAPGAGGQRPGLFDQQGFFNDGRVVPNIFKVINQEIWRAADKSSGVEYAITYPFVMAMSGALFLPQAINDIPNIPSLLAAAMVETDHGNYGKALEAGGDAVSALGIAGEIAEGFGALGAVGERDTIDYSTGSGALGGRLLSRDELVELEKNLSSRGVKLKVGSKNLPQGKAAAFDSKSQVMILGDNPTEYEVAHEMAHLQQWEELGYEAYSKLSVVAKEQYVYDTLTSSSLWENLTEEEKYHAGWVIEYYGGIK
ncbi:MAG: zincin-like metallopeptidase toxin domain-containing protein [Byssovorax sp.]